MKGVWVQRREDRKKSKQRTRKQHDLLELWWFSLKRNLGNSRLQIFENYALIS